MCTVSLNYANASIVEFKAISDEISKENFAFVGEIQGRHFAIPNTLQIASPIKDCNRNNDQRTQKFRFRWFLPLKARVRNGCNLHVFDTGTFVFHNPVIKSFITIASLTLNVIKRCKQQNARVN